MGYRRAGIFFALALVVGLSAVWTARRMIEDRLLRWEKLSAMGQMAGEVGHELNNYLASMSIRAELIPYCIK